MTQKNLLYFMNRFNVVFHYAEANFSQGQLVLMQLVHTLLRSTSDLDTIEATHPQEAYHHFLESLRGVRAASEVAQEACRWTSDHREEMVDLKAIEQRWNQASRTGLDGADEPMIRDALLRDGILGLLRVYEKRLGYLQEQLREHLANPLWNEQVMQVFADKKVAHLLAAYHTNLGLSRHWEPCNRLHMKLNQAVSRHHATSERGATIL
jgi:hypothetical protein